MFLDRLGVRSDAGIIRRLGLRLANGQCADGSWSYTLTVPTKAGDNSNTQFAALACWVCRRHGSENDDALLAVDRYFRTSLNVANGGWGYTPRAESTPSMTCAGLVALATERGATIQRSSKLPSSSGSVGDRNDDGPRRDLRPLVADPVVAVALAHLGRELKADRISERSKPNTGLYFFWSLERVGVIYGVDTIGGVDWYRWGKERLLRMQRPDGGWGGEPPKFVGTSADTCFAMLFLARSNVAEDLTGTLGGWQAGGNDGRPQTTGGFMRVERKSDRRARDKDEPADQAKD